MSRVIELGNVSLNVGRLTRNRSGNSVGYARLQVRDDRHQVRFGLGVGDAGLAPAEQVDVPHALDDLAALQRDRQVDVGAAPHEPLRHHADHRADVAVQPQLAAEHVRIAVELALPEPVAEDHHRLGARRRVGGVRRAAEERRHAHDVERVEGPVVAAQPLRVAVAEPQHVADRGGDDPFEDPAALRDLEELIHRIPGARAGAVRGEHAHAGQVVDVLVRKRIEHDRVQHAVDRRRRHDAERQRQHRQRREPRRPEQAADPEPDVAGELLEPVPHVNLPYENAVRSTSRLLGTAVAGSSLPSISRDTQPLKFAFRSVCAMRR